MTPQKRERQGVTANIFATHRLTHDRASTTGQKGHEEDQDMVTVMTMGLGLYLILFGPIPVEIPFLNQILGVVLLIGAPVLRGLVARG